VIKIWLQKEMYLRESCLEIHVREKRRGNQEWRIQRHRQHCKDVHLKYTK